MRVRGAVAGWVLFGFVAAGGCGGSDKGNDGSGASGGSGGSAGSGADGGVTAGTGGTSSGGTSSGGTSSGGSAGAGGCQVTMCQSHIRACGDCVDNDGDGKTDMNDPDCLGPCHNAENTYYANIPGGDGQACILDCYFDQDSGSGSGSVDGGGGNDDCNWNHRCDPLSVSPKYPPEGVATCAFNIDANTPGTPESCGRVPGHSGEDPGMYDRQSAACLNFCGPLTPNGCDCFGCCELPAGGGKYVWLGSETDGQATCTRADVSNPDKCRPCTPVKGCLNTCERCELCLGKDTLPADCSPQPPDGGSAGAAGAAGAGGTGGTGTCAQVCGAGVQKCGNGCGACAAGYFCLTGCCIPVPE
ncbi:MAG TPA: hypothetical protein VI072_06225 [Polyangiaceae bacterium]